MPKKNYTTMVTGFLGGLFGFPLAFLIFFFLGLVFNPVGANQLLDITFWLIGYIFTGFIIQLWTFKGYSGSEKFEDVFFYWLMFVLGAFFPTIAFLGMLTAPAWFT